MQRFTNITLTTSDDLTVAVLTAAKGNRRLSHLLSTMVEHHLNTTYHGRALAASHLLVNIEDLDRLVGQRLHPDPKEVPAVKQFQVEEPPVHEMAAPSASKQLPGGPLCLDTLLGRL